MSILFGSETLILTNQTIDELERIQSKFVNILITLPKTTPNICAQTETGLRFIKHNIYPKQLTYFYRILKNGKRQCGYLMHYMKTWTKIVKYINKIRDELHINEFISKKEIKIHNTS